jgi:hypothetical protein
MTATGVTPALSTFFHLSLPIHKFLSLLHALIRASSNLAEFFCASWQLPARHT